MSEPIRYVLLSDLHLGDRDSILTRADDEGPDARRPGRVLVDLVACLADLLARQRVRPTLIVNGDFLDLAFGSVANALMMFERFAELALRPGAELFDALLYLPGNHDHHMWETAREHDYRERVVRHHHERGMPEPCHATPLEPDAALAAPLLEFVLGHLPTTATTRPPIRILYPNLALADGRAGRCLVIHHGHYVEPVYSLFSRARRVLFPEHEPAREVEAIERENFAWIDFVWSLLGRSGAAGEDAETLFEMLRYPARTRAFAAELADRAAPHVRMPFLPWPWMRRVVLRHVFTRLAGRLTGERAHLHEVCTPTTMHGIHEYLFGPVWRQVERELGGVPEHTTFLFGHTHKPFETLLARPGGGPPVSVVNSGGWTVDTDAGSPAFGASVVLLSEALEVASVRVYNDGPSACDVPLDVRVPAAEGFGGRRVAPGRDSFAARVAADLAAASGGAAWQRLRQGLHAAVAERRMRHRRRFGAAPPSRGASR